MTVSPVQMDLHAIPAQLSTTEHCKIKDVFQKEDIMTIKLKLLFYVVMDAWIVHLIQIVHIVTIQPSDIKIDA